MKYADLRDFIAMLEQRGELVRIRTEVDPHLEMTEIADRTLRAGGPALLFENPKGSDTPVLANLFGTEQRVALGMGAESLEALREITSRREAAAAFGAAVRRIDFSSLSAARMISS